MIPALHFLSQVFATRRIAIDSKWNIISFMLTAARAVVNNNRNAPRDQPVKRGIV